MAGQLAALGEGLLADAAVVRPLAAVGAAVGRQPPHRLVDLAAKLAGQEAPGGPGGLGVGVRRGRGGGRGRAPPPHRGAGGGGGGGGGVDLRQLPETDGEVEGLRGAGGRARAGGPAAGRLEGGGQRLAELPGVEGGGLVALEGVASPASPLLLLPLLPLLVEAEGVCVLGVLQQGPRACVFRNCSPT